MYFIFVSSFTSSAYKRVKFLEGFDTLEEATEAFKPYVSKFPGHRVAVIRMFFPPDTLKGKIAHDVTREHFIINRDGSTNFYNESNSIPF